MLKTRSAWISLALTCAAHCVAYADDARPVDVPPGDLTMALEALARQSGIELIYDSDQLKGLITKGINGTLSGKEAAERLIEGTNLTLRTDATGAMMIAPKEGSQSQRLI